MLFGGIFSTAVERKLRKKKTNQRRRKLRSFVFSSSNSNSRTIKNMYYSYNVWLLLLSLVFQHFLVFLFIFFLQTYFFCFVCFCLIFAYEKPEAWYGDGPFMWLVCLYFEMYVCMYIYFMFCCCYCCDLA